MPAVQDISLSNASEMPAISPQVILDGVTMQPAAVNCLSAERRMGLVPGSAVLRIDALTEQNSPITLNAQRDSNGYSLAGEFGARVKLRIDGQDVWRGWLVKRQDSSEQDAVFWTALEDSWLLSKMFLRGAYVFDPVDKVIKYVETFTPHVNPGGSWNCIEHFDLTSGYTFPVFSPYAAKVMTYESPEFTSVGSGAEGTICAWTPRRFLRYLRLVFYPFSHIKGQYGNPLAAIPGVDAPLVHFASSILGGYFETDVNGMKGYDPAQPLTGAPEGAGVDPLDRKMQSSDFQGVTFAEAMDRTLKSTSTHDVVLQWDNNDDATWIKFVPIRWSGDKAGNARNLKMPRGGAVSDTNVCYGFDVTESIEGYAEAVVVDGAPIKVETRFVYNPADLANSTILPAWTGADELAWVQCVSGKEDIGDADPMFAKCPVELGDTTWSNFFMANGDEYPVGSGNYRPLVAARGELAVRLAMENWPLVFRAFKLNPAALATLGTLAGVDAEYSDTDRYVQLKGYRPLLPMQLQYLVQKLGLSDDQQGNWICGNVPIRITVVLSDQFNFDLPYASGLRVSGDGTIWLDPYTVQAKSNFESILGTQSSGDDLRMDWLDPWNLKVRKFYINAAVPIDTRVTAVAKKVNSTAGGGWGVSDALRDALTGVGPVAYFDNVYDYQEHHQVNSYPTGNTRIATTHQYPLNRLLPPGSEQYSAYYAAQRKLVYLNSPKRDSTWRLPGINLAWAAGDFLGTIEPVGSTERPYQVRCAVPTVLWDFVGQKTELGGLQSAFASE